MKMTVEENRITEKKDDQVLSQEVKQPKTLLKIENLKTYFFVEEGVVKAVDGVSFTIFEDEVLGLVGETGCGKSVTALSIIRLVRAPGKIIEGKVTLRGVNLLDLTEEQMRLNRGNTITMIFQDPLNSLNPVLSVGRQVSEVFYLHQMEELESILDARLMERERLIQEHKDLERELKEKEESGTLSQNENKELNRKIHELKKLTSHKPNLETIALEKSAQVIKEVGIADAEGILKRFPHELSGGMRQRVMIAMALSCNPALLIADEPTTALDVTIQAQILELMRNLKKKFKTSILMITHDLGIIADICDRVAVMYSGNIVEYAYVNDLFKNPRHPYTQGLIGAIPSIEKKKPKATNH